VQALGLRLKISILNRFHVCSIICFETVNIVPLHNSTCVFLVIGEDTTTGFIRTFLKVHRYISHRLPSFSYWWKLFRFCFYFPFICFSI